MIDAVAGQRPGISERIRQHLTDLSPAERRVARVLLVGPPTIGLETSARLAADAGVSGPTVSRFVARLGFDNYADFQRTLHEDIAERMMSPVEVYRQHQSDDGDAAEGSGLLQMNGAALAEAVSASVRRLNTSDFCRATALLADRRRQVLIVGGWFSHFIAGYMAAVLREIRPRVRTAPPIPSERAAAISDVAKGDVAAIFDFRRYERDTLDLARALRAAGARIVLFTDPWLSPIAEIADAVLPAEIVGPSPVESLTPTLAVVETLVTAVADTLGADGHRHFEKFGAIADSWMRPWPSESEGAARRQRE